MIENFADKDTKRLFDGETVSSLPAEIHRRAYNKLRQLDFAGSLRDLAMPPSNRLEVLSGKLCGFWSIRINDKWRIVFQWNNGVATAVKVCDYH
ncbi:MAG: type II toxin-antitoxin system RelE/ParE family toxin [Opitutae bacterium]|nr:type II toxin-antitoxin system RelE/ParE family toxin [Opitutae bacterium]